MSGGSQARVKSILSLTLVDVKLVYFRSRNISISKFVPPEVVDKSCAIMCKYVDLTLRAGSGLDLGHGTRAESSIIWM